MKTTYRVMMFKDGRWEPSTDYADYAEAELAARGLITSGQARECYILEITANGERIAAHVSPDEPEIGGALVVRV